MNQCPHCGFENLDKALFCAECGSKLTQADIQSEPQKSGETDSVEPSVMQTEAADRMEPSGPQPEAAQHDESADFNKKPKGSQAGVFLKVGIAAALAGISFAVGLFGRQLFPEAVTASVLEIHHDPVSMAVALCFDAEGYTNVGSLTVTGPQGQVLDTIEQVKENCYQWIAPCRSVVYLDSQDGLYLKETESQGQEAVCLTEKTDWSSLNVSQDGSLLIYSDLSEDGSTAVVYDLQNREEKAVLDTGISNPFYDVETGILYYLNSDNTLMAMDDSGDTRRIKGDVSFFQVQGGIVSCSTMAGKGYIIGDEEISLGGTLKAVYGDGSRQQYVALVNNDQTGNCQLVMCVPSLEPAVLEKAVQPSWWGSNMAWARASRNLYYIKNGSLYRIAIPELDEKVLSDQKLFEEAVDLDKEKLASGIDTSWYGSWKFSPNGENLAWINGKEELEFYCHPLDRKNAGEEEPLQPLVVEEQVRNFWIWDHALVYLTQGWELKKLPLAPGVLPEETEDVKTLYSIGESQTGAGGEHEQQTDTGSRQQGFRVITSPYGDYVAVADPSTGLLRVFNSEEEGITLEPHMETHTKVSVQNSAAWEKPFTLEDIAGFYCIEDDNMQVFMEISSESRWSLFIDLYDYLFQKSEFEEYREYEGQTIKINAEFTLEEDGSRCLVLYSDVDWDTFLDSLGTFRGYSQMNDSGYDPLRRSRIEIREDGSFYWIIGEDYEEKEAKLTRITSGKFAHAQKVAERKAASAAERRERSDYIRQEQERIREEKKRQEEAQKRQMLEERGRAYLRSGVYLPARSKLYSYPGSYYSSVTTSKNETWTVYDYQVDVSDNCVWLKLKNARNEYYWVSR